MCSNRFIALMSAIILREHPGSTVVTDSVTSNGLTDFITKLGGKHLRQGTIPVAVIWSLKYFPLMIP
jgi:phosphomannomutase